MEDTYPPELIRAAEEYDLPPDVFANTMIGARILLGVAVRRFGREVVENVVDPLLDRLSRWLSR